ncbi:MAG: ribosome recycling factor [Ruminococcaceae bacterium]|nr:ribosome recycling factor [Oscillospiraceae bacterium]
MSKECEVYTNKMQKTIEVLKSDFATVRAGRANPGVLDKITVEHYGSTMYINQLAQISVPEPRMLAIQPWDASARKAIVKAIQTSDLGINPQDDGKVIRLVFPQLTEERRKDLSKQVRKMGEDGKVAIRNIRRDAVDTFKKQQKKSEITEDDLKLFEKEIQDATDKYCKDIDTETARKEKELMEL